MAKYISPDITAGTYTRARLVVEYSANTTSNNNSCKAYVQMWRTNTGYTTSGSGTLYIKTADDSAWWSSSITDSQKITYNSYTQVGSTRSWNIANDSTGRRTIKFYVKATSSIDNIAFDQQEFSVTLEPCPVYTLSISAGTGSSVTVNRTSSPKGSTGNLTAGSKKLYYGDKLKITFTPSTNYNITTHTVNGSAFTSGGTHTVSKDVAVVAKATPLKSLVAATDANIESTSTIVITRYNSAYTHTLTYNFKGLTGTIATKTTSTTVAWTIPKTFYAKIPNDPDGSCTITCTTYNGSTSLGSNTCTLNVTAAKSKVAPLIEIDGAGDDNENTIALTGDRKKIIRYHSDLHIETTMTAQGSASLTDQKIKCGSRTIDDCSVTFTDADSVTVSATATDTRGYSTTENITGLTLIPYEKLTVNAEAQRTSPTSDTVKVTAKGNYFNGSFGAVDNTLRLQVRFKPKSKEAYEETDGWTEMTVTISGNSYTAEAEITGLDYQQPYDIRVRGQDKIYVYNGPLANAVYHNIGVNKGIPMFDWGEDDFNFNVAPTRSTEAKTMNLCYEAGDTLTQQENIVYAGLITGSTKNLYFFIPLDRPVAATTATVEGTVIGRGVGGYINGTDGSNSQINLTSGDAYSVEAWLRGNGIQMVIRFTTAITNATNNTPVAVVPYGSMKITFS